MEKSPTKSYEIPEMIILECIDYGKTYNLESLGDLGGTVLHGLI